MRAVKMTTSILCDPEGAIMLQSPRRGRGARKLVKKYRKTRRVSKDPEGIARRANIPQESSKKLRSNLPNALHLVFRPAG